MGKKQYSSLAKVYDTLNFSCDYDKLAQHLIREIKENESVNTSLVLDLACGTGAITFRLHDVGYDMTGIDLSEDMLSVAREESYERGVSDILWLCQDMTDFELYGTVDACVCCLDSINYLTKISDVKKCFSLVYNYLVPDGLFIFDVNTPYRFKNVYGNNDYILESQSSLCAWQNQYNEKSRLCQFFLSIFQQNEDGTYTRSDEIQVERCYSLKQIKSALSECGFELIGVYGDTDKSDLSENNEKWYFTARCKKNESSPNYRAVL
ncbi:MAG: class I SAM-dependent methyltransferase [Clostridia bacterium]|nr:class I SAM-dependent methyltransferase [Clostridia bacterium]